MMKKTIKLLILTLFTFFISGCAFEYTGTVPPTRYYYYDTYPYYRFRYYYDYPYHYSYPRYYHYRYYKSPERPKPNPPRSNPPRNNNPGRYYGPRTR